MQQSRSKELVLIYRKLISNILERSTYGIRYGILNIDQHNLLFNKDHVKQLLDIELLDKNSERFHGLTEEDKSLIKQFSIILSLPFLSPSQQIEKLLSFKMGEDVFISLIKTMDEITSQEFEGLLCRPLEEHQILNLIYYANMKEVKINEKYKEILLKNIFSNNSSIRKETFLAINLYKDLDLLKEFINSKWSINKIGACEHEVFYGSLLWMLSLKMNLVDEEIAIRNIAACAFGNTVDYFSENGLKKISFLLDDLFCIILEKQLSLPSLEIIEVIPYNNKISLFSIDRKEIDNNFESQMKELSESGKEFQERQRNQHEEFINYKTYLKNNGLEFILRGMLPNSFSTIANSNPKIRDSWFDRCSSLKEQDVPKLYNFILLLAYTYSEIDIQKAQLLWRKVENSESFSKIYIGQEKISLKQMSVWGVKNENLNPYRFHLLDKAMSDEEIYSLVLAAIVNKNDSVIHNYIKQKINSIEPAQIARGVLVAGCLDENYISNEVFSKYTSYKGIIGEAYKASLYMYERNIWSKYWFKKMVSTEDKEEFWRYMILFTKIVDSRFYNWKDSVLNENNLFKNFYQSFRNDINNRCKKWQKERSKKLFGNEPPNPIYIYSQD